MLKKLAGTMSRDKRGIVGLNPAITLIGFMIMASLFAYTVVSEGPFSSQNEQEAIYASLKEARASMELKGCVFAYGNGTAGNMTVTSLSFVLTNALEGQPIDLTPNPTGNESHMTVLDYSDKTQHVDDMAWDVFFIGKNNGDTLLDQEEQARITVHWSGITPPSPCESFTIVVKPVNGAVLALVRALPARIDPIMDIG